jgi:hypothetical protein
MTNMIPQTPTDFNPMAVSSFPYQLEKSPPKSYFESRMEELGITPDDYRISVNSSDDSTTLKVKEIFSKQGDDIRILYPNLDGGVYTYTANTKDNPEKTFYRTRLKIPKKDQKYTQTSGSGFFPFFPPKIIEKFTKKEEIKILYLVEGEFKAFKGSMHGLNIIGICGKDLFTNGKGSKDLHHDIVRVIEECKVKNIVLLLDADSRTVTWEQDKEITERPHNFMSTVQRFKSSVQVLTNQEGCPLKDSFFIHIKSEYLKEGKGLDDLLVSEGDKANQVIYDLNKLDKSSVYFDSFNLGRKTENALKKFFGLEGGWKLFQSVYAETLPLKNTLFYGNEYLFENGEYITSKGQSQLSHNDLILSPLMKIEFQKSEDKSKLIKTWREDALNYTIITTQSGYYLASFNTKYKQISFDQISNFTLKILYHIRTSGQNKRVIELVNDRGRKLSVDIETKQLTSLGLFKEFTEGQGNFRFFGKPTDLEKLKAKWFEEEKPCVQLDTLGYNKDGFFAFSNGLFNHVFHPSDKDGVVSLNDKNYFIPYSNPKDESQFLNEKKFSFKPSEVSFREWSKMYVKCFGEEGGVVLLYGISCIFSDIIFKYMTNFPIGFLYGEGGTGKSKAISFFQLLFGEPQPALKLSEKANTDKAKIRKLAQFVNAVGLMEEFKNSLDDATIKTITGLYDRFGYEKANITTRYGTDTVPINSGVLITGNEYPTDDPLMQRLILLDYNKNKFSDEDIDNYEKLKQLNEKGLTSVLGELIQFREEVKSKFEDVFSKEYRSFRDFASSEHISATDRMMNSYAMILTTYQIIAPLAELPIKYDDLQRFLIEKLRIHNERRETGGAMQMFWDCIFNLARKKLIEPYKDYKIENGIIAIKLKNIHPLYLENFYQIHRKSGLGLSNLRQKLMGWDAGFKGAKDNYRFSPNENPTSCLLFDYEACKIDLLDLSQHK